jgi:hypothetical protein
MVEERRADKILQQAKWLKEQYLQSQVSSQLWNQIKTRLASVSWFLPLLGQLLASLLFLISGLCIFNLLVKFVSFHLE